MLVDSKIKIAKNKNDVKANNILNVLSVTRQRGPLSRRDIQKETHLSWGTVSTIITHLIDQGVLVETDTVKTSVGRNPSVVDFNESDNFIVGIDMHITSITVVLINLKGQLISKKSKFLVDNEKNSVIDTIFSITDEVIGDITDKKLLAIGVAAQGIVDSEEGVSIYSSHFSDWHNVEICKLFEARYRLPAYVFHDPDCVLFAEKVLTRERHHKTDFVAALLRLEGGIGMSVFIGGKPYKGAVGRDMEIGHLTMNAKGPKCSCGKSGCLEVYSTTKGIVQRFFEKVNDNRETLVNLDDSSIITYMTLYEAMRRGDALCKEIFQTAGFYLGLAISHVINLLNPGEIILYGSFADIYDAYEDIMHKTICENVCFDTPMATIRYYTLQNIDAAAIGSALLAFEKYSTDVDRSVWLDR